MCSYCFFQRDHSMRRYVSISTINSPEQTRECVCVALVCVCLHEVASPSIALIPPRLSSAKWQIIRGRPEASAEQLWMKLYPVQKKSGKRKWQKKREGKKQLQARNHSRAWVLWENTSEKHDSTRDRLAGKDNTQRHDISQTLRAVDPCT